MSLPDAPRSAATLVGFGAVLLWSTLATLTVATGRIPPFELTAVTFAVGSGLGLAVAVARGRARWLWPAFPVLCLGVAGLFGDYVLYFGALRLAPAPQAALIVALWPLIMVFLAALLVREPLRPRHVVGAACGLTGLVVLSMSSESSLSFEFRYVPGYLMALGAAVVWASYSVLSRRHAEVPTETLTGTCLVAAALAALGHVLTEPTVVPETWRQDLAIVAVGLGPAGGSFFLWDHGMKRGSVRVLAILGYAVPVLSMVLLVATGYAQPSAKLSLACILIMLAGVVATNSPAKLLRRLGTAVQPPRRPARGLPRAAEAP